MKKGEYKRAEDLTDIDFARFPVWELLNDDSLGESSVRPVKKVPVASLSGRLVGIDVELANGAKTLGMLGNVKNNNPRLSEHMRMLSIYSGNKWFHLARYHDVERGTHGPQALAAFLGLPLVEIFPIRFDISSYVVGDPSALSGLIEAEPSERLSRSEIIALSVP